MKLGRHYISVLQFINRRTGNGLRNNRVPPRPPLAPHSIIVHPQYIRVSRLRQLSLAHIISNNQTGRRGLRIMHECHPAEGRPELSRNFLEPSSVRRSAGFSGQKLCLFAHASLRL